MSQLAKDFQDSMRFTLTACDSLYLVSNNQLAFTPAAFAIQRKPVLPNPATT
jgi:hypothetical protein